MIVNTPVSEDTGGEETDDASITTGSFDPPDHSLVFIVLGSANNPARTHDAPTSTLSTGTWSFVGSAVQGFGRISVWRAQVDDATAAGTITQTLSAATTRKAWIAFSVTGHDRGTNIRESNTGVGTATTLSVTMTDEIAGHTMFIGAILSVDAGSIGTGTGGTELVEATSGAGANESRIEVQYGDGTTFDWSGLAEVANAAVVWEVNVDPGFIMTGKVRVLGKSWSG